TTNTGATETVTVTVTGTNDGPTAVNDTGAVNEGAILATNALTGVISNDTDPDTNDTLSVTSVRTGAEAGTGTSGILNAPLTGTYGTLTLQADGSYSYVADQVAANALADGTTATDVFTYTISDGNGGTDTAELIITVTGTNDAPVAVDDTGAVDEGASLVVDQANGLVDSNDTDVDGDTLTITSGQGTTVGTYGTLVLNANGSYTYTADQAAANALAAGETATEIFNYTVSDGEGGSDTATLTITVTGTNDGPTAVDDTASTNEDTAALNIDLLGDDTDPDGDTLSLIEINGVAAGGTITLPSGALLTVNGDGTVNYDPNGQFDSLDETQTATDTFTYTISDGNGGTDTATATVTINGTDDATVTVADEATPDEGNPVT
ncbi:MAG: Ig-like domain-containing protein, partial [Verrucomicrobiales bacterium]|nr:Ig-like domain-containing protein [Verrucomicrobiales bacterium]